MKETNQPTLDEIMEQYDSYLKELSLRDKHLKLIVSYDTSEMDEIISLLDIKEMVLHK